MQITDDDIKRESLLDFLDGVADAMEREANRGPAITFTAYDIVFMHIQGADAFTIIPRSDGMFTRYNDALARACQLAQGRSARDIHHNGVWVWDDTTGRDVGCYLDGKAI